uniref:Uncharacterized protein n=1 Tax=Anguilla anguilla TaxID=7936 RepID=A0A0E9PEH7_ANGAN
MHGYLHVHRVLSQKKSWNSSVSCEYYFCCMLIIIHALQGQPVPGHFSVGKFEYIAHSSFSLLDQKRYMT